MSRKLIIPRGLIDGSEKNVIEISPRLAHSKGNLIAKKQGNKIVAQQLPDWQDELSSSNQPGSSNLVALPVGCAKDISKSNNLNYTYPFTTNQLAPQLPFGDSRAYSLQDTHKNTSPRADSQTCYNTSIEQNPSNARIQVQGKNVSINANVESNVQVNDAMLANVVADTRRAMHLNARQNTSGLSSPGNNNISYSQFNPLLSSTQNYFEPSSIYDSDEESNLFFMGPPVDRSRDGMYNIISAMTPSPPRSPKAQVVPPTSRPVSPGAVPSLGSTYLQAPCSQAVSLENDQAAGTTSTSPCSQVLNNNSQRLLTANQTFRRAQPSSNQTFLRQRQPNETFAMPCPANQTFVRPKNPADVPNATFNMASQQNNQTFAMPPQGHQTFVRPKNPAAIPEPTFNMIPQQNNQTFAMPSQANQTFVRPKKPAALPNATFNMGPQQSNQTFVRPKRKIPQPNATFNLGIDKGKACSPCSLPNISNLTDENFSENFTPQASSTHNPFELSSLYDSDEESNPFFLGPIDRSKEGIYNIISPMTPSPPKAAARVAESLGSNRNRSPTTQTNETFNMRAISSSNAYLQRSTLNQGPQTPNFNQLQSQSIAEDCACEQEDDEQLISYNSQVTEDVYTE